MNPLGVTASVALVPATASASVANSTLPAAVVEAAGTRALTLASAAVLKSVTAEAVWVWTIGA
jgi:hypothetical protein